MVENAEVPAFDVYEYVHGLDTYRGLESIQVNKRHRGPSFPIRLEFERVPSALEPIGHNDPPVRFTLRSRSKSALEVLAALAPGDATFRTRLADGTGDSDLLYTITNAIYEESGIQADRERQGFFTLSGTAQNIGDPSTTTRAAGWTAGFA
jgi:hypothetical protein